MLPRVLEPEVMDTQAEARDYDAMDHRQVNERFVSDLLAVLDADRLGLHRDTVDVLDVGTGTALIPIELCRRLAPAQITAVDLSAWMLKLGRRNVREAGFADRIRLEKVDAKAMPYADQSFEIVISNSIVHHVPDPAPVLAELARLTARSGVLFVRDLLRPADDRSAKRLVATYAADANDRQRALFDASLRAALTVEEVRGLVAGLGLPERGVAPTSDRHWTWVFQRD